MQNENSSQFDSRWHRPNLYITIPSIYLLVLAGISALTAATIIEGFGMHLVYFSNYNSGYAMLTFSFFPILVCIPSIIGAVKLFQRKKIGFYFSIAAFLLIITVLPYWIIFLDLVINDLANTSDGVDIQRMYLIIGSTMISGVVMWILLAKGNKQVSWKK